MKAKDISNTNTNKNKRAGSYYWGFHFFEIVFLVAIILFIICEALCLNVDASEVCEGLEETTCESRAYSLFNFDSNTLNLLLQIVVILLPLLITILTLSFALLPRGICGVSYSDFRKFGVNKSYSFLHMILISIFLFIACIICLIFNLEATVILIDSISIFYVIFFLILEIPLLSREDSKINSLIRKAYYRVYIRKDENFVRKDILNAAISNRIQEDSLLPVYNSLRKNQQISSKLTYEGLLTIYSDYLADNAYRGTLSETYANSFLKCLEDYLNAWKYDKYNPNKDKIVSLVSEAILKFIKLLRLDEPFDYSVLMQIYQMLIPEKESNFALRGGMVTSNHHNYSQKALFTIGISNFIITHSFASLNLSCVEAFISEYTQPDSSGAITFRDDNYFVFISVYIYYLYLYDKDSGEFNNFYSKFDIGSKYNNLLAYFFIVSNDINNDFNAFTCTRLLKYFLDFYYTVGSDYNGQNAVWCILPKNYIYKYDCFLNFTSQEIFKWWITFLFCLNTRSIVVMDIEERLKALLKPKQFDLLLETYSMYWTYDENGEFAPYHDYEKYFTKLGLKFDYEKNSSKQIRELFNKMISERIVSDGNGKSGTNNNGNDNSSINGNNDIADEDKATPNEVNPNNDEKKNNNEDSKVNDSELDDRSYLEKYINEHLSKYILFDPSIKNKKIKRTKYEFSLIYTKDDLEIDQINPREKCFELYFSENSYCSTLSDIVRKDFASKFVKFKNSKPLPDNLYTDEIYGEIDKFNPDEKYISYSQNGALNFNVTGDSAKIWRKLLAVKDCDLRMPLNYDTYLRNKPISVYAACTRIGSPKVYDEKELRKAIQENKTFYKANQGGKYLYRFKNFVAYLTLDQLVEVIKDRIYEISITFEYKVAYKEDDILVFYRTNDDGPIIENNVVYL